MVLWLQYCTFQMLREACSYSPVLKKWSYTGFALSFRHSVIIQMKIEYMYLWGQLANLDQILYEASLW